MKKVLVYALMVCFCLSASCTADVKEKTNLDFDIQNAVIMEITVLGKPGFAQITDEAVIAQVTDSINNLEFAPQKTKSPDGDAYEIKWFNKKAERIETMIVTSDIGILYGKNSDNYEAVSGGKINYELISKLIIGKE